MPCEKCRTEFKTVRGGGKTFIYCPSCRDGTGWMREPSDALAKWMLTMHPLKPKRKKDGRKIITAVRISPSPARK